jgi:hypothetical protein
MDAPRPAGVAAHPRPSPAFKNGKKDALGMELGEMHFPSQFKKTKGETKHGENVLGPHPRVGPVAQRLREPLSLPLLRPAAQRSRPKRQSRRKPKIPSKIPMN